MNEVISINNVIVEVIVLGVSKGYDVLLPLDSTIKDTRYLLAKSIEELSGGKFKCGNNSLLIDYESGMDYDDSLLIKDTNITNGTKLILN